MQKTSHTRSLSLVDCIGIGVNGIIGTGIFMLTAPVWRQAGGKAPLAWLMTGTLCSLVALCFAAAAAKTEKSGGPYRYARDVFGPNVGFVVGWITLFSIVVGYASVVRFLAGDIAAAVVHRPQDMEAILPFLKQSYDQIYQQVVTVIGAIIVFGLAGLNLLGVRMGALSSTTTSVLKVVALLVFVGVGLFFVRWENLVIPAHPDVLAGENGGLWAAAFVSLFAMTGVEYISVPAGEVKNPKKTVPLALMLSVAVVTVTYLLVQIVVGGVLGHAGGVGNGISAAAEKMAGPWGGRVMRGVFILSALGFCTGSALVGPRYVEVLAQDQFLPAFLMRRLGKNQVPTAAILLLAVTAFGAMVAFEKLVDVSNLAVISQYLITCLALLVGQRSFQQKNEKKQFVLPGGPLIPLLTLLGCGGMLVFVEAREWKSAGISVGCGLIFGYGWRFVRHKMRRNFSGSTSATVEEGTKKV